MDLTTVGDVIAERRFVLVRPDGSSRDILASLGKPEPHPGSEDFYYCRYQIVGFKAQIISWASGVDGFQAIQLASLKLGIELANNQEGQVFWHGELHSVCLCSKTRVPNVHARVLAGPAELDSGRAA